MHPNSFGCGADGAFMRQPRVAHRSPPCKFFSRFFGDCNLQNAIDFAELERNAARSSAWQALHLSLTFSCGHIAAHHAAFYTSAFCKVQLILRSCLSSQGKAWLALHLNFNF